VRYLAHQIDDLPDDITAIAAGGVVEQIANRRGPASGSHLWDFMQRSLIRPTEFAVLDQTTATPPQLAESKETAPAPGEAEAAVRSAGRGFGRHCF
jgi:hypothetical protein